MLRILLALGALSAITVGCGQTDTAVDCNDICNRADECLDLDHDTCFDRCTDHNDDMGFATDADRCDGCLSENEGSCASDAVVCASECSFVLTAR